MGETALSKALPNRPVLDKAGIKVLDIIHFGGECTFPSRLRKLQKWPCKKMRTLCLLLVAVRPWIR